MNLILITGGSRSGKSKFSEELAIKLNKKGKEIGYLATGVPIDKEFEERISLHKKQRLKIFKTYEEPIDIEKILIDNFYLHDVFLLDCVTTWLGNVFFNYSKEYKNFAEEKISKLIEFIHSQEKKKENKKPKKQFSFFNTDNFTKKVRGNKFLILVTNEIGSGIVPLEKSTREYRDLHGKINQSLAEASNFVYLVVTGIPVRIL